VPLGYGLGDDPARLEPLPSLQYGEQRNGTRNGQAGHISGSVKRVLERQALEVHSVDAADGNGGQRNCAENVSTFITSLVRFATDDR
jgi:hypothetical protein